MNFNLSARVVAEFLGTAFLLAAVVGSGIMAEPLASGNLAIALLVHGFDFICHPRGYTGPRCQRHLCRDSSC